MLRLLERMSELRLTSSANGAVAILSQERGADSYTSDEILRVADWHGSVSWRLVRDSVLRTPYT